MKKIIRKASALLVVLAASAALTIGASAVELKTGIGIVETGGLRLRAKPNTESEILDNAGIGDSVVIIRESGDFYLVDYNLQIGYMSKDYITFKERENVELGYGRVIESAVHLREKPDSDSASLTQLAYGEKAYIIGFNCGWYKVTYGNFTGYIRSDLLELTEKPLLNAGTAAQTTSVAQQLIDTGKTYLGVPYVWGGTTPDGFDCSGFTRYVFNQYGYSLKRTAAEQFKQGTEVSKENLQPGDLVFFERTYNTSASASHVGIYIGDNQFLHAGGGSVKITEMSHSFYASRYVGARRILS